MAVAARNISVVVSADSAPLQAAVAKAADSLQALGGELAKQSSLAVSQGREQITSNAAVADSYVRTGEAVRGSVLSVVESIQTQKTAQAQAAEAAVSNGRIQVDASARAAEAAKASAGSIVSAADAEAGAYRRTASAATASAGQQVAAATRSRDAHVKGFAASGGALVDFGKKATIAAGAIGGASLFMASKFESATLKLSTQAGASHKDLEKLRDGVLNLAGPLGQTPEHLAEGLYHVVSSMGRIIPPAHRVSEELKIMEVAAKGAAVGGTSMEETSYALASAMNALHQNAGDAEKTMGQLNAIVGAGDMTMQDLLEALKSGLIPTAHEFGLSLQSVGAALAVMGDMGVRGSEAGTRLRMSIALLGAPSQQAAKMLTAIGMGAGEVHARTGAMTEALQKAHLTTVTLSGDLRKPNGLVLALRDLRQHLEDSGLSAEASSALLVRAFGGGRMSSTILTLSQNTDRLNIKFKQIGDEGDKFGKRWQETQKTLKHQADETVASLEVLGIRLGEKLAPAAGEVLSDIKGFAEWLVKGSDEAHVLEGIVGGIAATMATAFAVNKINKWVEGVKQAAGVLGKLTGLGGGSGRGGGVSSGIAGGIMGSRGPIAPGSLENPIAVVGFGGGGLPPVPPAVPGRVPAGAGGLAQRAANLAADHPFTMASLVAAAAAGLAAAGKPGVVQTPGNIANAAAHGADPTNILHLLGLPSLTDKLLPGVNKLGFDPFTDPQGAVYYMLTGKVPHPHTQPHTPAAQHFAEHPDQKGPGHPQAVPKGAVPHKEGVSPSLTKQQAQAGRELAAANHKVAETQGELNNLFREGKQHTPEYTKLLRQLATAERERGKAVAELAKASAQAAQTFQGERSHIESTIKGLEAKIRSHPSAGAIHQVALNYSKLIGGMETELTQGKISVGQFTNEINKILEQEAKSLGVSIKVGAQTNLGNTPAPKGPGAAFGPGLEGATGIRIPGPVGPDDTPIVSPEGFTRGIVAGGELLVANRHTEDRVNSMLSVFGTSLGHEVAGEQRPHDAPRFARGGALTSMIGAANQIDAKHYPYVWGGGHGGFQGPYDCSGAVSAVLHAGGLLNAPRVSGDFENYGLPGPGEVSLYANAGHVYMSIDGKYFGTSGSNPGGGAGWFPGGPRPGFVVRHVAPGQLGGAGSTVRAPKWTGPGGAVGAIGKAVLGKEAKAASSKLQKALDAAMSGTFGGGNANTEGGGGATVTASEFGGHNDPSAFNKTTASGAIANDTLWGFAELSHPGTLDFSALGHLPMGQKIAVTLGNKTVTVPKVDVGGGGSAVPPAKIRGIDLTYAAARRVGLHGLQNVEWHKAALGGRLRRFATGGRLGLPGARPTKHSTGKPKASKGKHGAAKAKVPSFGSFASNVSSIPALGPAIKVLEGIQSRLEAQRSEEQLLTGFESQPAQILPKDMRYLNPTLQAGQAIKPGMSVPQAERDRQHWLQSHAGTGDTDLQGELLSWISGLDNHKLLSSADVGIMSSLFHDSGVPLAAGYPMFAGQQGLLQAQIGGEKMIRDEMGPLVTQMHQLGVERQERQHAIKRVQDREVTRLKGIHSALRALASKKAKASDLHRALSADAKDTRSTYTREIAAEKARKHPDRGLIRELENRRASVADPPAVLGTATAKDHLKNQLPPIEEVLQNLGGSKTTAGTGGVFGRLAKEIETLKAGITEIRPKISEASTAIPTLESTLLGIKEAATNQEESIAPVKAPGTANESESALKAALEERNRQLQENLTVSEAQFKVLHAVTRNIPHYDQGGPVVDDGLIYAHRGEHVVPAGGTLVSHSSPPNVKVDNHFHGVSGELIEMIDSRVSHPENVRKVGQEMGRRVQLLGR